MTYIPPWLDSEGQTNPVVIGNAASGMTRSSSAGETCNVSITVSPATQSALRPRMLGSGSRSSLDLGASAGNIASEVEGIDTKFNAFHFF